MNSLNTKNHLNDLVVITITYEKNRWINIKTNSTSKWLLNWFLTISFIRKKQVDIKIIIHVHFKWVEHHHHFSHFSISHQRYTTNFTLDYHDNITQKISHTMMINYPRNPYDKNDSRSWRWWYQKISHTMRINYPRNPYDETTQDHEDDGIMETEEEFEEEESLFEDIVCCNLYLIVGVLWYM